MVGLSVSLVVAIVLPATLYAVRTTVDGPSWVPDDHRGATWVATDPIQCEGVPFHDGDIVGYYAGQGIEVLQVDRETWASAVPAVCGAKAGFTLFLLVSDEDVEAMVRLGYRVVER